MANSGNGTFIPMVSSSPPPMDDGAFDDDEDEFSEFSGSQFGQGFDSPQKKWPDTSSKQDSGPFVPIKNDPPDPFQSSGDKNPPNDDADDDFGTFAAFDQPQPSGTQKKPLGNGLHLANNNLGHSTVNGNDNDDDDEFADFASFGKHQSQGFSHKDKASLSHSTESHIDSTVMLNKNNSHEKSDTLHSASFLESSSSKCKYEEKQDHVNVMGSKETDTSSIPSDLSVHIGDSTGINWNDPDKQRESASCEESETFSGPQNYQSAHDIKDSISADNIPGKESSLSALPSEKPSTGSLSLFQESDRQTFDSGIDSIMTPSDSSPEGKDDLSMKEVGDGYPLEDLKQSTVDDHDDWGDFGSTSSFGNTAEIRTDNEGGVGESSVSGSSLQPRDNFGDFGSFSQHDSPSTNPPGNEETITQMNDNVSSNSTSTQSELKKQSNEDNDEDFGDFSNASKGSADTISQSSRQDLTFDDFGDFESTQSSTKGNDQDIRPVKDSSGDDWAGFSSATTPSGPETNTFGDFGAFSSSASSKSAGSNEHNSELKTKDDNDFGSFGNASSSSSSKQSGSAIQPQMAKANSSTSAKVPAGGRVERLFKSCFPKSSVGGVVATSTSSVFILQEVVASSSDLSSPSGGQGPTTDGVSIRRGSTTSSSSVSQAVVWSSLSDMENTMAQKYHWNNSRNSGKLLTSLGIDSRNILSSGRSGRPFFDQGVGILTPSKPGEGLEKAPSSGGEMSSGSEDVAPTALPLPEDTAPKVEFDWSNSGLINPLDANSLNLDFFATERKSSTRAKTKPVQKVDPELLDFAVSPSDPPLKPSQTPSSSSSTSTALDQILKSTSTSMVKQKAAREAGLSSEANSVLDSFPDLSFMLAKVLMFPVASPAKPVKGGGASSAGSLAESIS